MLKWFEGIKIHILFFIKVNINITPDKTFITAVRHLK
jgi:hypothetical protein